MAARLPTSFRAGTNLSTRLLDILQGHMDIGVAAEAMKDLAVVGPGEVEEVLEPYTNFMPPEEVGLVIDQVRNVLAVKEV